MKERIDDYQNRREHLKNMSDQELKAYFLELSDKIVDPLLDLAYNHTSKSIERSVL
jgi:D-ornithine 4,5-aminomutase subunit alpha